MFLQTNQIHIVIICQFHGLLIEVALLNFLFDISPKLPFRIQFQFNTKIAILRIGMF